MIYLQRYKSAFMNRENIAIQNKKTGSAKGLIIVNQKAQELSKQQQTFNKLVKKIEKLRQELEQTNKARTKNISSIYRQLAKAFHPDLEQDEELKLEKEHLMKELTAAYEKNDLHTLLRLEIFWIKKEENNPDKLSDDKLKIYNEALKEQVQELEDEIDVLSEHPRYEPLQKFAMFPHQLATVNVERERQQIEDTLEDITASLTTLKRSDKEALAEVKNIIQVQQHYSKYEKDFEVFFR